MCEFLKHGLLCGTLLVASVFTVGCVGRLELADGQYIALNSKEFQQYVETVFKYQNRVADELAFALVDVDPVNFQQQARRLEDTEANLLLACSGLNQLATAQRDGLRLGVRRKLELARQVPACEQAAVAASSVTQTQ